MVACGCIILQIPVRQLYKLAEGKYLVRKFVLLTE